MAIQKFLNGRCRGHFRYKGKKYYGPTVDTAKEAKAWVKSKVESLIHLEKRGPILMYSTASKRYLADCKARVQPGTYADKFRYLREFAEFIGDDFSVENVTTSVAKEFIACTQRSSTNKSANRRLGEMKTFWKWLGDEVTANPWTKVEKYGEEAFMKHVPRSEDVAKVLNKAGSRQKSILLFLLNTGARIGEVYQLTWEDIDFERDPLRLWTRKRKNGNRQPRSIPISGPLRELLEELLENRAPGDKYVFINPNTGKPYGRLQPAVRYMMRDLCRAAAVKHFGFHSLRHYVARMLIEGGQAHIGDIQSLFGHQNATTTDIYLKSLTASPVSHVAPYIEDDVIKKTMAATPKGA